MSIKPIDMQIMLNNTANVNKVNNTSQHHNENQLMFNQQFKQVIERDNERTVETNKSEDERIKDDKKGNKGQHKQNKKDDDKKENETTDPVKRNKSSSIFDVSI